LNNIVFDRISCQVTGYDRLPQAFEFSVNLPYSISLSKTISELTGNQIQKADSEGLLLFKDNIQTDEFGVETYTETTETQVVTEYQTITNTYRIATEETTLELQDVVQPDGSIIQEYVQVPVYEEIITESQIPIEFESLQPIMIDEYVDKIYTLENGYMNFTYEEILEAKQLAINNNNLTNLVYYDEDFLGSELILTQCSIGDGIVVLHSNYSLQTPSIPFSKTTNIIELYIESQDGLLFEVNDILVEDGRVKLLAPTNEIIIKVSNPTNKNLELYALGGLV